MARDRHLPGSLAAVHPRFQVPHRAEPAVGSVAAFLAATVDERGAIGFSSFGVLAYCAVANASAWTLDASWTSQVVPALGLVGCVVVTFSLPAMSVVVGAGVLASGWRRTGSGGGRGRGRRAAAVLGRLGHGFMMQAATDGRAGLWTTTVVVEKSGVPQGSGAATSRSAGSRRRP